MHAPYDQALSPSQLNRLARDLLESGFPAVLVEGEIGSLSRPSSGHLYFTLKDAQAQIRCAMFRTKCQWLRFAPREGMRVLARGRLTLYEARGDFQLVCDTLEEAGEGALRRAFEALKARLAEEGLFDSARKRILPKFPRRIAVLTSPTGAVIRDILHILRRRFPLLDVELLPVPVQGDGAAARILDMLQKADASRRYDILLLARGGGSLEDLWAFNDEALARAVAACTTPVISAIGHETDFTLTDFVADVRAPTPSAAAELLAPDQEALTAQLASLYKRLHTLQASTLQQAAQRADHAWLRLQARHPQTLLHNRALRLKQARIRLHDLQQGLLRHARQRIDHAWLRLQAQHPRTLLHNRALRLQQVHMRQQMILQQQIRRARADLRQLGIRLHHQHPRRRLEILRQRLSALQSRPDRLFERQLHLLQQRLQALATRPANAIITQLARSNDRVRALGRTMNGLGPQATLQRGYSILQRDDGQLVCSLHDVQPGEWLRAYVSDGWLWVRVESLHAETLLDQASASGAGTLNKNP